MELDNRLYVRYLLELAALDDWRRHCCFPRLSSARSQTIYAAAIPLLCHVTSILVTQYAWRPLETPPDSLFRIQHPHNSSVEFILPSQMATLFQSPRPCERMFEALFAARIDPVSHKLLIAHPLFDLFRLLQLLMPGCFLVIDAEYISHDVDDDGEVSMIRWTNFSRALPPPEWLDAYSSVLLDIFGQERLALLRRAAAETSVLTSHDITFS
ncbi:hypothetical protein M422DRAFT_778713 [Sphaerobolus stellatus SS14]|uniref:Uncharacterized protein n=1 Tax=Sphaerobolus stellatus (strain SS14) TaxID=990650 RepID=A0A0C9W1R1_SPHS4|nr:hypothetical protein M422DRAFT_778713 [Sphaerobolus stellatus SS14]